MLNKIQQIAEKDGIFISYDIINQYHNGEGESVEKGLIPEITFTLYVTDLEGKEIAIESFDNLNVALQRGLTIAEEYIKRLNLL